LEVGVKHDTVKGRSHCTDNAGERAGVFIRETWSDNWGRAGTGM